MPDYGPSMTKQAHKDECDINRILERYRMTGVLTHVSAIEGHFGDMPDFEDFHEVQNFLLEANEQFMALPAKIRAAFDNDVQKLVAALDDPDRHDELIDMGLIDGPKTAPEPVEPAVEPEPESAPSAQTDQ